MLLKRLYMVNWLKKLMLIKQLILLIKLKKPDYNTKIAEIEKKTPGHDRYITANVFDTFPGVIFDEI